MYSIDKQFDFCYGHRVHNQVLDKELSVDGLCKCRHLHGHNGRLKIGLQADELERGMVTDFKNLECIKVLVDDILDHKFIIDVNDPLFEDITSGDESNLQTDEYDLMYFDPEFIKTVANREYNKAIHDSFLPVKECMTKARNIEQAIHDKLNGFVVVDFVPTSENLCKMFAEIANKRLESLFGSRVKLSFVDFWETPKSHCRYEL